MIATRLLKTHLTAAKGVAGLTESNGAGAAGVYGYAGSASGNVYGVHGITGSGSGGAAGVYAENTYFSQSTDLILGGSYGVLSSDDIASSDLLINSKDDITFYLDKDDNESGEFKIDIINSSIGYTVFKVDENGDVFADGGYNCGNSLTGSGTGGTVKESDLEAGPCLTDDSPADFAEMLPALPGLAPGDVLVIGEDGRLQLSSQAYQSTVMGVHSTRPSYLGGNQYAGEPGYAPLAISGIVPVKVTAEGGAITPGDLLVTSSTPGMAMRCESLELCFGRAIGKALEGLEEGVGVILVLVMLQ